MIEIANILGQAALAVVWFGALGWSLGAIVNPRSTGIERENGKLVLGAVVLVLLYAGLAMCH